MKKYYPAEVYVVGIYCDKCGNRLTKYDYEYLFNQARQGITDSKYKYNCPNCGHEQVEDCPPTYQVCGTVPDKIEVQDEQTK